MAMRALPLHALCLSASMVLAGCGGGDGGTGASTGTGAPAASPILSGVASKGPLNSATVTVYSVDASGSKGAVLGTGTTTSDNTGSFSIKLASAPAGAVLIQVSGGTYTSEYDGKTVQASSSYAMNAVLASVPAAGISNLSVTPISDLAAWRASALMGTGTTVQAALAQADQEVQMLFGLKSAPETVQPNFAPSFMSGVSDASTMALALFSLDAFAHNANPSDPDSMYRQLSADFTDGKFDNQALASLSITVQYGTKTYKGKQDLQADLFKFMVISVGAYANSVSPSAALAWNSGNPVQSIKDGVSQNPPGYSCSSTGGNPILAFDSQGNAKCWDGTLNTITKQPLIGPYTICSNAVGQPVAKVGSPSQCPAGSADSGLYVNSTTIAQYTAPTIQALPAVTVKPFTAADLQAMNANTNGAALPSWASQTTPLTADQLQWIGQETSLLQAAFAY